MEQNELVLPTRISETNKSASIMKVLRHGEILVRAGDELHGVFTVRSGCLKRLRKYQKKEFLVALVGKGDVIGLDDFLRPASLGALEYRDSYEAIGDVVVAAESLANLQSWWTSAPPSLGGFASPELRPEHHLKRPLDLMPVRARVAATLWLLAQQYGRVDAITRERGLDLGLTREEVAHLAGTVYESVIRTLTGLKRDGIIDLQGRSIRILKEDQLARVGQIVLGETND